MRETMFKTNEHSISLYEKIIQEIVCCFYIKGYSQEDLMFLGLQYLDELLNKYDLNVETELVMSMLSSGVRQNLQNLMEQVINQYFK